LTRQIFRAVERWTGMATVRFEHRSQDVQLQLAVVAEISVDDDGVEADTGQRFWSARVTGLPASVTGEVTVVLPGGPELSGRVTFDDTLSGVGAPGSFDRLPARGANPGGGPTAQPEWSAPAPGA
jgi:hypothetical protein